MITRENALAFQREGQRQIEEKYTRTRSFPTRYVANAHYRQQLTAEVDMVCDEQINRVIDRLNTVEDSALSDLEDMEWTGRIPTREWPLRGMLRQSTWLSRMEREYDCEVRR